VGPTTAAQRTRRNTYAVAEDSCAGRVGDVAQLPVWFPKPDSVYRLDPSYEHTVDPQHVEHQDIFRRLQKMSRSRLAEAVAHEFTYDAAMNSTGRKLTPLGQQYWQIAETKMI
jgi:hypothetical protein